jgi:hypothetical protein
MDAAPWQGVSYEPAAKIQTAHISWALSGNGTATSKRPDVLETSHVGVKSYRRFLSSPPFFAPLQSTLCYTRFGKLAVWPLIPLWSEL